MAAIDRTEMSVKLFLKLLLDNGADVNAVLENTSPEAFMDDCYSAFKKICSVFKSFLVRTQILKTGSPVRFIEKKRHRVNFLNCLK